MNPGAVRPVEFCVGVGYAEPEVVLGLSGVLDVGSAPELDAIFDALFDRGRDRVVLDMAKLGVIDGHGLQVVANAARRLSLVQGALTLRSPSAAVRQLIEVSGMRSLVRIEPGDQDKGRPVARGAPRRRTAAGPSASTGREELPTAPRVAREVLDDLLRTVVNLAKASVSGADGVSVSLRRDGEITTVAARDQTILRMNAAQYATREGPCLAASTDGGWFHISSIEEETRWPTFVRLARRLGIQAILSNSLIAAGAPVGALNIYSRAAGAFDPAGMDLASVFAGESSTVLSRVGLGA